MDNLTALESYENIDPGKGISRTKRRRIINRKKVRVKLKLLIYLVIAIIAYFLYQFIFNSGTGLTPYYENQLKAAELLLDKASGNKDKESLAYANIGYIYYKAGSYNKAIVNFNRAIRLKPKSYKSLYWLGMCYKSKEAYPQAIDNFKKAIEYAPPRERYLPYYDLGLIYEDQEKTSEAIEAYKKSVETRRTLWNPHYRLAILYEKTGKFGEAYIEIKKASEFNPDNYEVKKVLERISKKVK